jgi:DNA ligase D-like protein (predicted polymerase)/DNA ligase D-like protein (predicted 3'-phosphoesterase)
MALKEYKEKRSFTKTPEPKGGKPAGKSLIFVVQKHDASHLHYDFRLEMGGVLKSWAIPKGPSLNPADKRLAMQVEDHPFDYKDFEGIIPEGNYGAGTVMVWDTGTYEPLEEIKGPGGKELKTITGTKAAQNKAALKELSSGSLKIRLNGKKLKGEFALVQTKGRGENSWLLVKHRDKYASEEPVIDKDRSVVSKKTLEQIAKNPRSAQWQSNRAAAGMRGGAGTRGAAKSENGIGAGAEVGAKAGGAVGGKAGGEMGAKAGAGVGGKAGGEVGAKAGAKVGAKAGTAAGRKAKVPKGAGGTKSTGTKALRSGMPGKVARNAAAAGPVAQKQRAALLATGEDEQTVKVSGHELSFSHLGKVFWPKEKYTKRDLLNYYYDIAPYILPYLNNRPQSLNRHPNGITGPGFYQKNVSGKVPEWITTFPYHTAEDPEEKEFLVCTDEASLLYMISLGCIELNPWSSRVSAPDNPDWCIIDLDPDKKTTFDQVIEAALVTKKVLDAAGVESYCKTSGSTGIHVYFPLGAKYSYEHSKEFARLVVEMVHNEIPAYTTIERTLSRRKGKMYLDFLQNRPQATIAAPYSVRPKPGATVSAPLHWEEVKKGLTMQEFTIKTMPERVRAEGDLFKAVLGKGIDMEKALKKLETAR